MKNVQDIYPLSPMQQAMLLRGAHARNDDGLINQFEYDIEGTLDEIAFTAAWQELCERHTVLRTAFVAGKKTGPLQVVRQHAKHLVSVDDWRDFDDVDEHWASLSEQQRLKLDTSVAPLSMAALVRLDTYRYRMLWTCHHLILDRWCIDTVWLDLDASYQARGRGKSAQLRPTRPYSDYIKWLGRQDRVDARDFWRSYLAGFREPTLLGDKVAGVGCASFASASVDKADLVELEKLAKGCGVTRSIAVQAGIALLFNKMTQRQDVLFGITVSGRPPELNDVENILGSFVGNVGMRVTLSPQMSIRDWLQQMQTVQQRRTRFDYLAPAEIYSESEIEGHTPLYDTLVVTLGETSQPALGELTVKSRSGSLVTALPVTIGVADTDQGLEISCRIAERVSTEFNAAELCASVVQVMVAFAGLSSDCLLSQFPGFQGTDKIDTIDTNRESMRRDQEPHLQSSNASDAGREAIDATMLAQLLEVEWRDVLPKGHSGADDSFFEIGGDSLRAAQFHVRLESLLRIKIPIISLFREPTRNAMLTLLLSDNWPSVGSVVLQVRKGASSEPGLFMIASPEVNTVGYGVLARHLPEHHSAYVVQTPPASEEVTRLEPADLPALAAAYVREIRKIQPTGPYCLLGMCTGAQITLEMARCLREQKQNVAFAGIINTWAHYTVGRKYHIVRLLDRMSYYRTRALEITRLPAIERNALVKRILRNRFGGATSPSEIDQHSVAVASAQSVEAKNSNGNYDPWIDDFGWQAKNPGNAPYEGQLTVFRIKHQQNWRTGQRDLGWGLHAQATSIVDLDGDDHDAILRASNVAELASRLAQILASNKNQEQIADSNRSANA